MGGPFQVGEASANSNAEGTAHDSGCDELCHGTKTAQNLYPDRFGPDGEEKGMGAPWFLGHLLGPQPGNPMGDANSLGADPMGFINAITIFIAEALGDIHSVEMNVCGFDGCMSAGVGEAMSALYTIRTEASALSEDTLGGFDYNRFESDPTYLRSLAQPGLDTYLRGDALLEAAKAKDARAIYNLGPKAAMMSAAETGYKYCLQEVLAGRPLSPYFSKMMPIWESQLNTWVHLNVVEGNTYSGR
jgi:hypothetical protein